MARKFVLQDAGDYKEVDPHVTKVPSQVATALSTAKGNYEVAKVNVGKDTAHIETSVGGKATSRSVRVSARGGNVSAEDYSRMGTYSVDTSPDPLTDAAAKAAAKGVQHAGKVERASGRDKIDLLKNRDKATTASSPVRPPLAAARKRK